MKAINISLRDPEQRARIALYFGLAVNTLYAAFKLWAGIRYRSVWFGAVSIYYILLCTIKFLLIRTDYRLKLKNDCYHAREKALKSYRSCGRLLLLLNVSLAAIVLLIIKQDTAAEYSGYLLWAFGGYTVYRLVMSAIDVKKLRHIDDPLLSASKHLGISVALMSMFSLQTALLDRFCADSELRRLLNGAVGFAVCVTVIIIAVSMIVSSTRRLHRLTGK